RNHGSPDTLSVDERRRARTGRRRARCRSPAGTTGTGGRSLSDVHSPEPLGCLAIVFRRSLWSVAAARRPGAVRRLLLLQRCSVSLGDEQHARSRPQHLGDAVPLWRTTRSLTLAARHALKIFLDPVVRRV